MAYTLAIDKAEDLLAEYFKKYGSYFLSGIEKEKLELSLLMREMQNVSNLYKSHRLYVYTNAMLIWHRLFVEGGESMDPEAESVEDILHNVQKIFDTYHMDTIYYHLDIVFDFLRLEYYNHYKVWKQFEKHFEEVNNTTSRLMMNYTNYTFPAQLLISKLGRHIRLKTEENILEEAEFHFQEFESDPSDTPQQFILTSYQALGYYYAGQFEQAAKIMNGLLNDPNLKKYPYATVEIKTLLGLQYVILGEVEIFRQLTSSIQRQARLIGEDVCYNILQFNKILRITVSEAQKNKENKLKAIIPSINWENASFFSPVSMIRLDDKFIKLLCRY